MSTNFAGAKSFEKRILRTGFLEWWSKKRLPFDQILGEALRDNRVGSRQRESIQELAYALIRYWPSVVGMGFDPQKPDQMREFEAILEKGLASSDPVLEFERLHERFKPSFEKNPILHLKEGHGVPNFLLQEIQAKQNSQAWHDYLHSMNVPAPLCIRSLIPREELVKKLAEFSPTPTSWSREGLLFQRGTPLNQSPLFQEGLFEFQDEHSQLVSAWALEGLASASRILDLCAGAGGKTLHLAKLLQGRGEVFAYDISKEKLQRLSIRARKSGLNNIRVLPTPPPRGSEFDLVLVDAPCSSFGTLRRNPDRLLVSSESEARRIQNLQAELLLLGSGYVRKAVGSRLAYATCTVRDTENKSQVDRFLVDSKTLAPVDLGPLFKSYFGASRSSDFLTALQKCPANQLASANSLSSGTLQWGPSVGTQISGTLSGDGFFFSLLEYKG